MSAGPSKVKQKSEIPAKLKPRENRKLGLSPLLTREIFRVLAELNREGVTILLVEQNANMALKIASRAYVLEMGQIALSGAGGELLGDPRVKEAYLGG